MEPVEQPRFTEKETAEILKAAADLQGRNESGGPGISSGELMAAAKELGISPDYVKRAIAARGTGAQRRKPGFLGVPISVDWDFEFEGQVEDLGWEETITDLRRTFEETGEVSRRKDTWEWSGRGGELMSTSFSLRQAEGRVRGSGSVRQEGLAVMLYLILFVAALIVTALLIKPGGMPVDLKLVLGLVTWAAYLATCRTVLSRSAKAKRQRLIDISQRVQARFERSEVHGFEDSVNDELPQTLQVDGSR